jgi:hypothetical protein
MTNNLKVPRPGTLPHLGRDEALARLGTSTAQWGQTVPDDPGMRELAELLADAAKPLLQDAAGTTGHDGGHHLTAAAEALRSAARLGSLLPVISLWHLRNAVRHEEQARQLLITRPVL